MKELNRQSYPGVSFGQNVRITCETANIREGTIFEDNVVIEARRIEIGYDTIIGKNTTVKSIGSIMSDFTVGDNCLIAFNNQILVPVFSMMDYSQLHNSCLCSGYKPLTIGYNCWIGQGAILNSFESLTLGNNVRMGGSQIWTHVASGELLEGSNFHNSKPVVLEDNVWLMGFGHLITPGVTIGRNSVIMAGSVVSRSTEPFRTYSGIPAKDISDKLPAWKKLSIAEKGEMMKGFISEFVEQFPQFRSRVVYASADTLNKEVKKAAEGSVDIIIADKVDLNNYVNSKFSLFDITTKRYLKRRSEIEIAWIKFNLGFRSRFIPQLTQ